MFHSQLEANPSPWTVLLPWIAYIGHVRPIVEKEDAQTKPLPSSPENASSPSHHANDIESNIHSLYLLLWTVSCTFRLRNSYLADPRCRSPKVIPLPCPNNCAICTQGIWNPATILNAPRLPTIQLPTRNVTFSPFAEVHHFQPEHWYPSPPITPQQLPSQLPVIPSTRDAQASLRTVQSRRPHDANTRRATQRRSRDYPRVSQSANAKVSSSPRPVLSPGLSLGAENPAHYQQPLPVPTSRYDHTVYHPPHRSRSPRRSKRKLRQILRIFRRVFRLGS